MSRKSKPLEAARLLFGSWKKGEQKSTDSSSSTVQQVSEEEMDRAYGLAEEAPLWELPESNPASRPPFLQGPATEQAGVRPLEARPLTGSPPTYAIEDASDVSTPANVPTPVKSSAAPEILSVRALPENFEDADVDEEGGLFSDLVESLGEEAFEDMQYADEGRRRQHSAKTQSIQAKATSGTHTGKVGEAPNAPNSTNGSAPTATATPAPAPVEGKQTAPKTQQTTTPDETSDYAFVNEKAPSLNQLMQQKLQATFEKEKSSRFGLRKRWLRRKWVAGRRNLSYLLTTLSLLLFLLAALALLPMFQVESIVVEGNQRLDADELIAESGLQTQQHMIRGMGGGLENWLHFRYGPAQDRLLAYSPYLESVEITPSLPGQLVISVKERICVAYIQLEQNYLLVDSEGIVLEIVDQVPKGLPLIEGISDQQVEVGKKINRLFRSNITSAVLIMSTVIDTDKEAKDGWDFFSRIESIRPLDSSSHYLQVRLPSGKNLEVKLGSLQNMKDSLYWLRAILKQGELDAIEEEGLLDLSGEQRIFIPLKHFATSMRGESEEEAKPKEVVGQSPSEATDKDQGSKQADTDMHSIIRPGGDQPATTETTRLPEVTNPSVPTETFPTRKD